MPARYDVVIPTLGRPSLARLLIALDVTLARLPDDDLPGRVILVDDRPVPAGSQGVGGPAVDQLSPLLASRLEILRGRAAGPAAARNAGWRRSGAEWVAFVDDDVLLPPEWAAQLVADLAPLPDEVGATQGRILVPLPDGRRPTDWERNVSGLAGAVWATADMAYRRAALEAVGGFDERFTRAYREDADLALRVEAAGWRLVRGSRVVVHPVRPADRWISVRLQAGNADDALMLALHGRDWRRRSGAPSGRKRRHVAITAAGTVALAALAARRPRVATVAAAGWLAGTAELAWARIAPGPRSADEIVTMLATSLAIPPAATWWSLVGLARWRSLLAARLRTRQGPPGTRGPSHVLLV